MNSAVTLLERAAERFSDKIAIEEVNNSITYKEYRDIARKIATTLINSKYPFCPVVVYLDKNIKSLTSFFAARYASRPYVPVDINMPVYRLQKIIDSIKPCVLITDSELSKNLCGVSLDNVDVYMYEDLLIEQEDEDVLKKVLSDNVKDDIAYIIYTSGSTGVPKGAIRPDRGITDWVNYVAKHYKYNSDTVMASITPFYYEMSNFDVYFSVYSGAKLLIVPNVLLMLSRQLLEFLEEKKVNSIFSVPSVLINIANSGVLNNIKLNYLKNVMFSGEKMPNKQLNIWREKLPNITYTNIYGTSETSFICFYDIKRKFTDTEPLPAGRCSDYLKMYLLKEDGSLVSAQGEEGELCLSGSTMYSKYWNDSENSKKAFVQNPFDNNKIMYKTGDNAYINEYYELCFKTRKDFQIKRRGHRIELGEIECAAMNIDGVVNAAAIYLDDSEDIVLFLETKKKFSLHPFNIKLLNYIPNFMLPSKLVLMEKLFYKANGKMDRVKLKAFLSNNECAGKND